MSAIENGRDKILQSAVVRVEPVTLPPTVVVPPGQLAPGSLPGTVTGSDGTTLVNQGNFRFQNVIADQIDSRGLSIKDAFGNIILSAGVALNPSRLAGGTLPSNVVYASAIYAEQIIGGNFTGKSFVGGKFAGAELEGAAITALNMRAIGYVQAARVIADTDLTTQNLYVNGAICYINAPFAGTQGNRLFLQDTTRWASLVIDGVVKIVKISLGAYA